MDEQFKIALLWLELARKHNAHSTIPISCPNIEKFNGFINAMTPDEEKAFLSINENDRASKLHLADMDWSEADKSEMIQYLIEHLTTTTDDELTAADQSRGHCCLFNKWNRSHTWQSSHRKECTKNEIYSLKCSKSPTTKGILLVSNESHVMKFGIAHTWKIFMILDRYVKNRLTS